MKLFWRNARPGDLAQLRELHRKMEERAGKALPFVDPSKAPIFFAVVGETSDGKIKAMVHFEAVAELGFVADDPQAFREIVKMVPTIAGGLKLRRVRMVRAFIDKQFRRSLGWMLTKSGFEPMVSYEHWYRDLGQ